MSQCGGKAAPRALPTQTPASEAPPCSSAWVIHYPLLAVDPRLARCPRRRTSPTRPPAAAPSGSLRPPPPSGPLPTWTPSRARPARRRPAHPRAPPRPGPGLLQPARPCCASRGHLQAPQRRPPTSLRRHWRRRAVARHGLSAHLQLAARRSQAPAQRRWMADARQRSRRLWRRA